MRKTISLFFMVVSPGSGAVGHTLAHQALRPHGEHQDQHQEGEDVGWYWLPSTPPVSAPM